MMTTLLRFLFITALCELIQSSAWAAETYKFDATHSTIAFKVRQFLGVTNGRFTQFSGTIEIDHEHPERSSVVSRILVKSIDTDIRKRDDHLRSPEFFDVAKFPEIVFKSRSVKQTGTQSGDILGDLSMHGVTKPITLHVRLLTPFKETEAPQTSRWEVTADVIKRRDFGLMFNRSAEAISGISQDVTIQIEIEARKSS
jgi:polyisoprenoid-binding protein YceI